MVGLQISVFKLTKDYLTVLKAKMKQIMPTTQEICDLVKSIQIQRQNHADQILLIWMKTKKKCFKSAEPDWQTLRVRKLKESKGKNKSRKLKDLHNFKK